MTKEVDKAKIKLFVQDGRIVTTLENIIDVTRDELMVDRFDTLKSVISLITTGSLYPELEDAKGFYFKKFDKQGMITYKTIFLEKCAMQLIFHMEPSMTGIDAVSEEDAVWCELLKASCNENLRRVYVGAAFACTIKECNLPTNLIWSDYLDKCLVFVNKRNKALIKLSEISDYRSLNYFMEDNNIEVEDGDFMKLVIEELINYEKEYNIEYYNEHRYPLNVFHKSSLELVLWKYDLL